MTDIEGFLAIYGHSDNLLNNNIRYPARPRRIIVKYICIYIYIFFFWGGEASTPQIP